MNQFVSIKKIDGNKMMINLSQVVSVELIPLPRGEEYFAIVDTNNKTHLVDNNPLTHAHYPVFYETHPQLIEKVY